MSFQEIIRLFNLRNEKEEYGVVRSTVIASLLLKGTNLWILIFAIMIASLGLNINSTAVVIGAMLISPLMGPIIGVGFSLGTKDLLILKKSIRSYTISLVVGLLASTIYFLISPLNDAHSEILARTSPNIFDVLIAFFGGFAGILATSSKLKGNVIPGVAIATALMPPLCTAGYGLATAQWIYFAGAFYLFLINSVFIALATYITTRYLKYPEKQYLSAKEEKFTSRWITVAVILTLAPSLYLGYDLVKKQKFIEEAQSFVDTNDLIPRDLLIKNEIDEDQQKISLTFLGNALTQEQIRTLDRDLHRGALEYAVLEIKQGYGVNDQTNDEVDVLRNAMAIQEKELSKLKARQDSIFTNTYDSDRLFKELKSFYPNLESMAIGSLPFTSDSLSNTSLFVLLRSKKKTTEDEYKNISSWLTNRLDSIDYKLVIE